MTVIQDQCRFPCPAEKLPLGYIAIDALGCADLEEAAMRILWFSRIRRVYVSVSWEELKKQWDNPQDESFLIKGVDGLDRFHKQVQTLINSDYIVVLDNKEYAPTPALVSAIRQIKSVLWQNV